jgi:hypothetical protein
MWINLRKGLLYFDFCEIVRAGYNCLTIAVTGYADFRKYCPCGKKSILVLWYQN